MDESRSLQMGINTSYAIDALKNLTGTVTMPPTYDEMLAKGWLTQAEYDNLKQTYERMNQSVADNLAQAEANQVWLDKYYANMNATNANNGSSSTTVGGNTVGGGNVVGDRDDSSAATVTNGAGSGMNLAATIGIVLGAIATVILVVGVVLYYKRRPRDQTHKPGHSQDGGESTGSTAYSRMNRTRSSDNDPMEGELAPWKDEALVAVRVPLDAIKRGELVSRGGFGEVYYGQFRNQGVAIKMLLPEKRKDVAQIKSFLAEIKFMAALDHERIVTFVGISWESLSDLCVVTEFMSGGDLRSLLMSFEASQPPRAKGFDVDKIKIALHVAHALTYLHSLQPAVVHRDLKSRNILLDGEWNAKLTDFGVSREHIDQTMTAGVGSSLWMAPEVMMGERYDEKADVFSFGIVLAELDTQQLPYADATEPGTGRPIPQTAVLQLVSLGRLTISLTETSRSIVFVDLQQLARECVLLDPNARPTAAEALHRVHLASRRVTAPSGLI